MVKINGKTQLLGIFGDPISHSLSPAMQNAALTESGIDAVYLPFHVHSKQLESAVESIRSLNLVGVNVTVPHKVDIIPFLDAIDKDAALIGAVNTVVNRQGYLTGFNTDATGFLASVRHDLPIDPAGKKVVVLGAGGACRAALAALAGSDVASITVANRSVQKAALLVAEMQLHFPSIAMNATGLLENELGHNLSRADLLVNTTSVGLAGESFADFIIKKLKDSAAVYDMVYAPEPTPLLKSARHHGLCCADGRGMLVAQGEAAFSKWFGISPSAGVMSAQVIEKQPIY
jgi:shikimate dehydrogenase